MQNIIDLGFDPAALEVTKKPIMDSLLEVYNLAQKINDTQIKLGTDNSWQFLATSQKELANTIKSIEKANTDLVASITKANAAAKEDINFTKQSTQANNDNAVSIARKGKASKETPEQRQAYIDSVPFTTNLTDLQAEADAVQSTGVAVSELDIAQSEAANSATVWGEATAVQAAAQGELEVGIVTTNITLKEKIALEKQAALAAKEEAAINAELSNDYKQLSLAYNDAALKAKNYALALGINHPLTLEAAADAKALSDTLKEVDNTVGQNQRNVGNYAGSLEGAFAKVTNTTYLMTTAISVAARQLIRFGVQMLLFQVIGKALELLGIQAEALYHYLTLPGEAARLLAVETKFLADVTDDASKATGEHIAKLSLLQKAIEDVNSPTTDRIKAVKDYNDIADASNKIDATQIDNTNLINSLIERQIELIEKRALATAFENQLGIVANTLVQDQLAINLSDEGRKIRDLELLVKTSHNTAEYVENLKKLKIAREEQIAENPVSFKKLKQDQADFQDLVNLSSSYIDIDALGDKNGGKGGSGIHKLEDIQGKIYERFLKEQIDFNQSLYENDNNSYTTRLGALVKEGDFKIELLKAQEKSELKTNQETQDNISSELKTANDKQKANLLIDLANAQGEAKLIRYKYGEDEIKQTRDNATAIAKAKKEERDKNLTAEEADAKTKLEEVSKANLDISALENQSVGDRTAAYVNYYEAQQQLLVDDYNYQKNSKILNSEQLLALDDEYNTKRIDLTRKAQKDISAIIVAAAKHDMDITADDEDLALSQQKLKLFNSLKDKLGGIEEYNKKIKEIDKQAKIDKLEGERDALGAELLNKKLSPDDRAKLDEELKKKQTELNNAQIDTGTDDDPKTKFDYEVKAAIDAQDAIITAIDARYDAEKKRIEENIALVQRQSEQAIAATNNSTESQQQRTAIVAEIQRSTAQQEQALRARAQREDVAKAKFDKAAAIAKVVENTAIAVTAAAIRPWEIPIVLALGAIQLAAVASTPIPAYALGAGVNGRPLHGGGPALFGEVGSELVEQPGGTPFVAYRPTIMDLAPNTKITPMGNEMNHYLLHKTIAALDVPDKVDQRWLAVAIVGGITDELQNVTRAIRKQKNGNVNIHLDSKFGNYINSAIRE